MGKAVHVHWSLPDPAKQVGNMEENFTKIFMTLEKRVNKILETNMENMDKTELRAHLKKDIE